MIGYFSEIQNYNFGNTGGIKNIKNIFSSVNLNVDDAELVRTESIYPEERIEQLSYRIYNSFNYYWILMLLNGIKNPFEWNKLLGQKNINEDLERFDARVIQFYNNSPFIPTTQENGITSSGGVLFNFYDPASIDSYDGIDLSNILPGDTILIETGMGPYSIRSIGVGMDLLPSSTAQGFINSNTITNYYNYGQNIIPIDLNNQRNIKQLTCGLGFNCVLDDNGIISCWGDDKVLSLFSGFTKINGYYISSPQLRYKFIEASQNKLIAIDSSASLQFFNASAESALYSASPFPAVKTSWYHVSDTGAPGGVILKSDGSIVGYSSIPNTGVTYTDVSCGSQFCVGIMSNGGLTAWGQNNYEQTKVPSGTGFVEVSATYNHALARKADGTVYAWGLSAHGQCNVPNKTFSSIAAGKYHSAALSSNNELSVWGKIPKFGFTAIQFQGITLSTLSLTDYSIYGKYDKIYSGDHHVLLRGLTGTQNRFIGIVDRVEPEYKRIVCKVFDGTLSVDELFLNDPTGTIVTILRGTTEVKQILNKFAGIQKFKNATIDIVSDNTSIPVTSSVWKTVYILNYKTPESDVRLITLEKLNTLYNSTIKTNAYYVTPVLLQKIDKKIYEDLINNRTNLNYNLSEF